MKKLICFLSVVTFFISCSSDGNDVTVENGVPIILINADPLLDGTTTRASFTQDTQLDSGQKLYVWCKHTGTSDDYLKTWILTANGSGGFTGVTKYYPPTGTNIDIYALHGNIISPSLSEGGQSLPSSANAITHTVLSNQTAEGYAASDLLATCVTNKGPYGNAGQGNSYSVPLTFDHLLCRLEIEIFSSDLDAGDIASIELLTPRTTTTLTMPTYSGTSAVVGETANTTASSILMHFNSSNHKLAECIIPTQGYTQGTNMVKLTLSDGKTFTYSASQQFSFLNGKSYRFEMSFDRAKIVALGLEVTDWNWSDATINMEYIKLSTADDTSVTITGADSETENLEWELGGENSKEDTKGNEWF